MILFSLLLCAGLFIWFFNQIGITWMGILPIATIVALFFWSGIQSSHRSGIKQYLEDHLQAFSWILMNIGVQIIMSLYNVSWTLSSILLLSANAFLLIIIYLIKGKDWQSPLRAAIVFHALIYIITSVYTAYLVENMQVVIALIGMLFALLSAFWTLYITIIWHFTDINSTTKVKYEAFFIYHCLLISVLLKLYISTDPFVGLIIIQLYITLLLFLISKIKNNTPAVENDVDMDVEYILRGYRMNQIPTAGKDRFTSRLVFPKLQKLVQDIPASIYSALSISSIATTLFFCGLVIYYGQGNNLYFADFLLFLVNTGLYLYIFYLCKTIGVQDKLRRFFGFIAINICYFIAVAQVFQQDTVSILFWSIIWSVGNNVALNYMQELRSYLGKSDYQYWLMSNFLGLIIILYFFLTLNLDILLKVAIVVMIVGLWLLLNKNNLKQMLEKEQPEGEFL